MLTVIGIIGVRFASRLDIVVTTPTCNRKRYGRTLEHDTHGAKMDKRSVSRKADGLIRVSRQHRPTSFFVLQTHGRFVPETKQRPDTSKACATRTCDITSHSLQFWSGRPTKGKHRRRRKPSRSDLRFLSEASPPFLFRR